LKPDMVVFVAILKISLLSGMLHRHEFFIVVLEITWNWF